MSDSTEIRITRIETEVAHIVRAIDEVKGYIKEQVVSQKEQVRTNIELKELAQRMIDGNESLKRIHDRVDDHDSRLNLLEKTHDSGKNGVCSVAKDLEEVKTHRDKFFQTILVVLGVVTSGLAGVLWQIVSHDMLK